LRGGLVKLSRTCEECEKLGNKENLPKGARARFSGVYDCENCEIWEYVPLPENEVVLELYDLLPENYSGAGARLVSASDIGLIFRIFDIPEELQEDYYRKLIFLHNQVIQAFYEAQNKKAKTRQESKSLKGVKMDGR